MIRRFIDSFYLDVVAFAVLVIVAIGYAATAAWGQANNSNTWQTPGNNTVGGLVQMGLRPDGLAGSPISITAIFSGADTAGQSVSIPAAAGKFSFVCGFNVSGLGATAATTVNPLLGTLSGNNTFTFTGGYTYALGAAAVSTPFNMTFSPCISGNTINTAVTLVVGGAAGNTATTLNIWGYQQ